MQGVLELQNRIIAYTTIAQTRGQDVANEFRAENRSAARERIVGTDALVA